MAHKVLWIQLENKKRPYQHTVADVNQNLDDLATEICEKKLKNIDPEDLEFYGDYDETEYEDESDESGETEDENDRPLRSDIQLKHLKTSALAPLIVRYPLSNVRVHIQYNLSTSKGSVTLPHSTGLYYKLRQEVYQTFQALREGDPEFYFVQHLDGRDGDNIKDEFQLNAIVEDTPTKAKKREISLDIKIEGRKAYGDYTIKEVSRLFVKEEWNSIGNAPKFNIETLPASSFTPTDEEFEYFVQQLRDKNQVFAGKILNETTAREFISVFMTTTILLIQNHHLKFPENLQLFVEEFLSGSRGYGPVDYLVKYLQLVVMLNEAKRQDFDQGAAQNIVQMHSALEV
ncbi:hypothetical protein BC936DRAFT_146018 [Jimgerdemannia flammicorona]|uniref:Uncharacterized protein n=1 Tax=Jimgerdemannia flammicorona TaxID=994334 RepID=A0A433D8P7_9FUNG|nr:hypothetical protein BC936DRAFT_146018 [Jimgerdemannia flammicorona]